MSYGRFILKYTPIVIIFFQGCGGFDSTSDSTSGSLANGSVTPFSCTDDSQSSETISLILSKEQLSNAIEDLFGSVTLSKAAAAFSSLSDPINDSSSYERQSLVSFSEIDGFHNIAEVVSKHIVNDQTLRESVFGACASITTPTANCIDSYLNSFAKKIFRRPLSDDEKAFAKVLVNSSGDYKTNLQALLSYHLQSPYFLWRLELGAGGNHTPQKTYLTQYEIATRLSFAATNSIPDQALLAAAEQGKLSNFSEIKSQSKRLLQSNRGRAKVGEMLSWWSLSNRANDITGLPAELLSSLNTNGLSSAMHDETLKYVDQLVFNELASFYDLLTSKKSFASHSGLASIYGHQPVTGNDSALFGGRRQGLLMRAAFFTVGTTRTSLIHRGVDFQKRFLCNEIPTPNVDIVGDRDTDILSHEELLLTSNREAVAHQTKSPVCMSCHRVINPTGFAFENFDSVGRLRSSEMVFDNEEYIQDLPIDTSTSVPLAGGEVLDVFDGYDLVEFVARSSAGSACMSKNLYRYLNEKKETKADHCELARVHESLSQTDKPIVDALVDLIANEHIGEKVH